MRAFFFWHFVGFINDRVVDKTMMQMSLYGCVLQNPPHINIYIARTVFQRQYVSI